MTIRKISEGALFAAVYVVATICIAPIAYGAIQFRISDCMLFFCIGKKQNIAGFAVGGAIANLMSPLGIIDVFMGFTANFILGILANVIVSKWLIVIIASVFAGLFIGIELSVFYATPYIYTAGTVAAGTLCSMVVGVTIYKIFGKNKALRKSFSDIRNR